jgi:hypothetical protein
MICGSDYASNGAECAERMEDPMDEFRGIATKLVEEHLAPRDPEDRPTAADDERAKRERNLDKTVADSFPTSDPPSTIPDPAGDV